MTTDPTWIYVGAPVAVQPDHISDAIEVRRIERMTATEIVLDNGNRYRRNPHGYKQIKQGRYATPTELIDPNSPAARGKLARKLFEGLAFETERMRRNEQREHRSAATYRDLLDRIRLAATAAIQEIDDPIV